ncbi:hypothetical protein NXH76_14860 [Blautia schinkii]|nr:hypothetical protein [Blautia schinkii]
MRKIKMAMAKVVDGLFFFVIVLKRMGKLLYGYIIFYIIFYIN